MAGQAPAPPALHQAANQCFPPIFPRRRKNSKARKHGRPSPCPSGAPPNHEPMLPTKSPAHKRPVLDRAVCGFAAIDIAAVLWLRPKHIAAIQLPRTKHPFPNPRAASGWLPAAAFHPANPQAEASAKFLVPFSKKGTSFRDGKARPRAPRYAASATVFAPAPCNEPNPLPAQGMQSRYF